MPGMTEGAHVNCRTGSPDGRIAPLARATGEGTREYNRRRRAGPGRGLHPDRKLGQPLFSSRAARGDYKKPRRSPRLPARGPCTSPHPGEDSGGDSDHLVLNPHWACRTLTSDALNHVAVDSTFYGGPGGTRRKSRARLEVVPRRARDRCHLRRHPWSTRPRTGGARHGADIDAALAGAGSSSSPATPSASDMGRDRFEAARGHMLGGPADRHAAGEGCTAIGARWVAETESPSGLGHAGLQGGEGRATPRAHPDLGDRAADCSTNATSPRLREG